MDCTKISSDPLHQNQESVLKKKTFFVKHLFCKNMASSDDIKSQQLEMNTSVGMPVPYSDE